ncbi:NADPH:quinone reductase-like Zn-dependent oxidoreductase [Nocardia transvalensis]|uniref:NADPH:quinone reductase-like Zn-dependent oxidoreductase n=1 Tax=Nocardia transvalensis TaxID=37333 RepID=A0A7W9PDH9_9NOCA|nr:NADP-dependent oxidoreductase [Nocardia transvalensis]MBB5914124.1 NADPH:quinone reductase-like Zn-dependent oxidoreductase [Nocardia transvalensis]
MRAMVVHDFGGRAEPAEVPTPAPGPGGIQIRIEAAGVNPFDRKIVDGILKDRLPYDFPMIPGIDGAGTVSAVGPGTEAFAVGDRVAGKFLVPPIGHGTFAEYIVVPERQVTTIPDAVTALQAAALPTAGLTAQDLTDAAGLTPGQVVLINGAAGGVGSFLVQLANAAGAQVIATARADDTDRMIRLGAAEVVDYTRAPVGDSVHFVQPDGIDVLFDLVSPGPRLADLLEVVRAGGAVFSTVGAADEAELRARGLRGGNLDSTAGADRLRHLLRLVADGDVVVPIEAARPLTDAPAVLGAGGARGKTVLVV